jgi:hypothetical protein
MRSRRPSDTDPEIWRMQLDLLRAMSPEQRFELALSLSQSALELSRDAIRRLAPHASEAEVARRWVEVHYGADLAKAFRQARR